MFKALFDLFYPAVCAGCDNLLLSSENVICTNCRHEIPLTNFHLLPDNEAFGKFYGRVPVESVNCLLFYGKQGIVQNLIHKLKYKGHEPIGKVLGDWFSADMQAVCAANPPDAIVPVPLHKKRLHKRGYNQVETFARALSEHLGITYDDSVLIRTHHSKTQTKKGLFSRTAISEDLFRAEFGENHANKHFLIVDDVLTTGSTLEAYARALLKIAGARISIACMAFSKS